MQFFGEKSCKMGGFRKKGAEGAEIFSGFKVRGGSGHIIFFEGRVLGRG